MLIHLNSEKYHFWVQDMRMPEIKFIEPNFNINFDLEGQEKNEWLLHLDAGVVFGKKGEFQSRSTFKALCDEDTIFTPGLLQPAIKKSIEYSWRRLRTELRTYETDCPPVAKTNKEIWQQLTEGMINLYKIRGRVSDEDPAQNTFLITLEPNWQLQFLITFTLQIIYNMISRGYPFKPEENLKIFTQYVPEPLWKRIYFKCNKIRETEVQLTMKEMMILYYCIDCAAQCIAGKTYEKLKKVIYDFDFEMRNRDAGQERQHFLKYAQHFLENLKKQLVENGIYIKNFDTPILWDDQIVTC